MFKSLFFGALVAFGMQSYAMPVSPSTAAKAVSIVALQDIKPAAMLNWTVGSTADYNINMGFISGTMHAQVREETPVGFWIQQDMDLGFMGAQKVEIHINKDTGEVIELLVNGQKQEAPDASNTEIVESRREKVTVPKGEFDSIYVKMHDKKENKDSEAWVNPSIVPMGGMLKQVAEGPMGQITVELTDYLVK
jgi:hypothetical protein